MLSRTDSTPMIPVSLRSSVSRPIPAEIAPDGDLIRTCLPLIRISPASTLVTPKIASRTSVRPAPIRPARPRISPLLQVEADVRDHALAGQAADGHDHLADLGVLLREQVGQLATRPSA